MQKWVCVAHTEDVAVVDRQDLSSSEREDVCSAERQVLFSGETRSVFWQHTRESAKRAAERCPRWITNYEVLSSGDAIANARQILTVFFIFVLSS